MRIEVRIGNLVNRRMLIAACFLCAATLTIGNLSTVSAQGSGRWAIDQAQTAVRQQIANQERGRNQTIRFNNDAQTEGRSDNSVRVSGTGTSTGDNNRSSNNGRRDFTYEALVTNRGRNRGGETNVSDVRYDWRDNFGDGRGRGNDNAGGGRGNDNFGGRRGVNQPNGRVRYTGPIMNRHSDKGLDVAGASLQDGANVQQWGFSDQPNQNWNVVDLDNGEVALVSRHSGLALTVQGGRDMNGSNIVQRNWNDSRQQRWRLEDVGSGYFRIVSVANGKVLDVSGQGRQDGANIQLWDYANQANQQWRLKR